jgi:hypothetical protein
LIASEALSSFTDIFKEMPVSLIRQKSQDIVKILLNLLKEAGIYQSMDNEDSYEKIMVCNNACWAIGEISHLTPD